MNTPQKKIHNEKKNTEIVDIEEIAAYLKYWKWFVASVFVALTMAFLYLKTTPPTYEIFSNILITSDENNSGSQVSSSLMKSFGFGGLSSSSNIDDEVGILSSHTLVKETVKELGLYTSYQIGFLIKEDLYNTSPIIADIDKNIIDTMSVAFAFKLHVDKDKGIRLTGKILKEKITPVDIPALPYTLHTGYGDITFRYSTNTKAVVPKSSYDLSITIISGDLATEGYQSKIDVGIISKRSNIIALSTTDHVLQRGKEVLDKLIELYNIDALSEKNKAALNTEHFINERLTVLVSELGDIERRVEIFKKNNQMVDVVSEAGLSLNRMGKMKDQMVELEIKLSLINMIEDNMKKQANKYELLPGGLEILGELSTGIQTYNEILLQRSAYLRDMNETNPTILTLNERIDLMRKNIITSISNVKSDLLEARKNWEKQEKELLSRISNMPSQEREFIDIQRQQKLKSELYLYLLGRYEENALTLAAATPKAKIIDLAYNATAPISPKKMSTFFVAFVIGLMVPFVVLFLRNLLNLKIEDKSHLERLTDIPVLGEICQNRTSEQVVVKEGDTSSIAELFRLIRTNIQFILTKTEEKVIVVTSSISGEGKSFFVINFSVSLSLLKNKKVVMVGLDIRNPRLAEYLSIPAKQGITSYLASEEFNLNEIILPSGLHPNLFIVPAGPIPPNPGELLFSKRLDSFFSYMRNNFDYIVVDTAPVGMVSDTFSLERVSDATIYLCRAAFTNKSHIKYVENINAENKLKNITLVINGTKVKTGYGHGYGYGYGYGYGKK